MDSDLYQIKWANITDYILRQTLFPSSECGKKIAKKLQTIKYQPCMHACIFSSFAITASRNITLSYIKKLINYSRGKYKRNECLINVCKADKDLS